MSLLALRSQVSYLSYPGLHPYYLNINIRRKKERKKENPLAVNKWLFQKMVEWPWRYMSDQRKAIAQRWRKAIIILCSWLIKGYFCHLQFWESQESYSQTFTRESLEIMGWKRLNIHRLSLCWIRVKHLSFLHPPNFAWCSVNQDFSTFLWRFLQSKLLGEDLTRGAYGCGLSDAFFHFARSLALLMIDRNRS